MAAHSCSGLAAARPLPLAGLDAHTQRLPSLSFRNPDDYDDRGFLRRDRDRGRGGRDDREDRGDGARNWRGGGGRDRDDRDDRRGGGGDRRGDDFRRGGGDDFRRGGGGGDRYEPPGRRGGGGGDRYEPPGRRGGDRRGGGGGDRFSAMVRDDPSYRSRDEREPPRGRFGRDDGDDRFGSSRGPRGGGRFGRDDGDDRFGRSSGPEPRRAPRLIGVQRGSGGTAGGASGGAGGSESSGGAKGTAGGERVKAVLKLDIEDPIARATLKAGTKKIIDTYMEDARPEAQKVALDGITELGCREYHSRALAQVIVAATLAKGGVRRHLATLLLAGYKAADPEFVTYEEFSDAVARGLKGTDEDDQDKFAEVIGTVLEGTDLKGDTLPEAVQAVLTKHGVSVAADGGATGAADDGPSAEEIANKILDSGKLGDDLVAEAAAAAGSRGNVIGPALMYVLLNRLQAAGQLEGDALKASSWLEEDQYQPVLAHFLYEKGRPGPALNALFQVQRFAHEQSFPKGLMFNIFAGLYNKDVVEPEDLIAWKDDHEDETPGKTDAMFQLSKFFTQLAEAMEPSSSEEDSDEDSEDDDIKRNPNVMM